MEITTIPSIEKNDPVNLKDFDQYPPDKYPLKLSIWFGKTANNFEFDTKLQEVLKSIPKSQMKYRQTSQYARNYECYVQNLDPLKTIFNEVLGKTAMWKRFVNQPDERIFIDDLYEYAKELIDEYSQDID